MYGGLSKKYINYKKGIIGYESKNKIQLNDFTKLLVWFLSIQI